MNKIHNLAQQVLKGLNKKKCIRFIIRFNIKLRDSCTVEAFELELCIGVNETFACYEHQSKLNRMLS